MSTRLRVFKLGTECPDKATGLIGTLTHWFVDVDLNIRYIFQPKGLNDEGQPVKQLVLEKGRLNITSSQGYEEVEIPSEILGTIVTDKPTGFTGMAVELVYHLNGCFHVMIQPEGRLPKTNSPIRSCNFDLRSCTGEMITQLSEAELKRSKAKTPSPIGVSFRRDSSEHLGKR